MALDDARGVAPCLSGSVLIGVGVLAARSGSRTAE